MWWARVILFGCVGVLVEHVFTGVSSLLRRRWKATSTSYLWMAPIYGLTGLALEAIGDHLPWPIYFKALLYVPVIYGAEAVSGALLAALTGVLQKFFGGSGGGTVPWDYGKSRWSPFGVVNFKYLGFWYLLALAVEPASHHLRLMLNYLTTVK